MPMHVTHNVNANSGNQKASSQSASARAPLVMAHTSLLFMTASVSEVLFVSCAQAPNLGETGAFVLVFS
jgi:hypothetical protein